MLNNLLQVNTLFQLTTASVPSVLSLIGENDAVLLRQDSCYLSVSNLQWPTAHLFALVDDVTFRQLNVPANIRLINDVEWVTLCATAKRVISC